MKGRENVDVYIVWYDIQYFHYISFIMIQWQKNKAFFEIGFCHIINYSYLKLQTKQSAERVSIIYRLKYSLMFQTPQSSERREAEQGLHSEGHRWVRQGFEGGPEEGQGVWGEAEGHWAPAQQTHQSHTGEVCLSFITGWPYHYTSYEHLLHIKKNILT